MTSVFDKIQEQKEKYNTKNNTFDMFPIGTKVQVITLGQDHYFFSGKETGIVIKNSGEYLGIIIQFDKARHFEDGYIQTSFNFEPEDLIVLGFDKEKAEELTSKEDLAEYDRRVGLTVKTIGKKYCNKTCGFIKPFRFNPKTHSETKFECDLFQITLFKENDLIKRTERCIKLEV